MSRIAYEVTCPRCGVSWKGHRRDDGTVTVGANGPPSGLKLTALCLQCAEPKKLLVGRNPRSKDGTVALHE